MSSGLIPGHNMHLRICSQPKYSLLPTHITPRFINVTKPFLFRRMVVGRGFYWKGRLYTLAQLFHHRQIQGSPCGPRPHLPALKSIMYIKWTKLNHCKCCYRLMIPLSLYFIVSNICILHSQVSVRSYVCARMYASAWGVWNVSVYISIYMI
jgi:hypothetical protein